MRSEPASGATVTDRFPPRPRAAASAGVITSPLSDAGEARPTAAATAVARPVVANAHEVAALVVHRMMPLGPVRPGHLLRPLEHGLAPTRPGEHALDELPEHLLRLADQEQVDELRERLGVEERGRPARNDER